MSTIMAGRSTDPAENLKKKPHKGILKSSSSFEQQDGPSGSARKASKNKETTWDEMNIIETLHPADKDYGHMKIDEPKTPFERDVPDAYAVDPNDLAKRIEAESHKPRRSNSPLPEADEEDEEEDLTPEEKTKKRQFEMKRKAHYNEFLTAKKKLQDFNDDEDEEEH